MLTTFPIKIHDELSSKGFLRLELLCPDQIRSSESGHDNLIDQYGPLVKYYCTTSRYHMSPRTKNTDSNKNQGRLYMESQADHGPQE